MTCTKIVWLQDGQKSDPGSGIIQLPGRILAVAQVDRPSLVMQSRSCFSNTCTGFTRSAGSVEIKCASALKMKQRLFVFFICFER